jgi:uncharacterized RDD family membrane protein YckC
MNNGPDYTKYSLEELNQAYSSIDKDAFPERVKIILGEIEKRKTGSIEQVEKNNKSSAIEPETKHIRPRTTSEEKPNPYAGFWLRTGSLVVDALIMIPYGFLMLYLQKINYLFFLFFIFFGMAFSFFWSIYLLKRYGGTPGKLICGIKVIRMDGSSVDWKASVFRNIVDFPFAIYSGFFSIWMITNIGYDTFQTISITDYGLFISQEAPAFHNLIFKGFQFWFWGELIVLLFNKRKRAIHDFIAGTVVIKKDFEPEIEEYLDSSNDS